MAQGIWRIADSPDDPIFSDGVAISSHGSFQRSNRPTNRALLRMAGDLGKISTDLHNGKKGSVTMSNHEKRLTESFLNQFSKLLKRLYRLEESTGERQLSERTYIDGFMSAGLHLRVVTNDDLSTVIDKERARYSRTGPKTSTSERLSLSEPARDFSEYDRPTWERKGG